MEPRPLELHIEAATSRDVPILLQLIRALADYEQLSHEVVASEELLRQALFGPRPSAEALLGFAGQEAVGFAVFFTSFSTFVGKAGIYLEDIFVLPQWRGRGLGFRMFEHLARLAVERDCGRMEWAVLDWNQPALDFYRKLGAVPMSEWTTQRLSGAALEKFSANKN